ncbi:zinc ribbon domain-containing protein [Kitasatospora sp. NPDC093550]|uniref:zinc ribbon domain-containing protein n=1 Tax=Kitasatospora sp. NPDC093550 TaxID=3364089 RepID=UPI003804701E
MEQSFDSRGIGSIGGIDARGSGPSDAIDARGSGPSREIDARGIDTSEEKDARAIAPAGPGPSCPECGSPLRATGPGRRPVYCGRSCSSKAYRRRRAEGQRNAVAEALISSRVEIPDPAEAGDRELLGLADGIRRSVARYLERLDEAGRGGPDASGERALGLLESSVTSATQALVRRAHVLRHEMVAARVEGAAGEDSAGPAAGGEGAPMESTRVGSAGVAARGDGLLESARVDSSRAPAAAAPSPAPAGAGESVPEEADPVSIPDLAAATSVDEVPPESTHVDSGGPVARVTPTPAQAAGDASAPPASTARTAPAGASGGIAVAPGGSAPESTRVGSEVDSGGASTAADTPSDSTRVGSAGVSVARTDTAGSPERLRLALATERTSTAPVLRGLGAPTATWSAQNGAFLIEGWDDRTVFAVRRRDRQLAGWVETSGAGWASFIDGRAVIDSDDGLPWLAEDETYAVSLLAMALDQHGDRPA